MLAIAAMLMAIGMPALFGGRSGADQKSAVKSIALGLKKARNAALISGRETTFTLDVEGRAYKVGGDRSARLPPDVSLVLRTAESEAQSDKIGAIRFYPDGSSTGGSVSISPEGATEVHTRVSVDWLTGRISIDK